MRGAVRIDTSLFVMSDSGAAVRLVVAATLLCDLVDSRPRACSSLTRARLRGT
jgi:hypothetical protein